MNTLYDQLLLFPERAENLVQFQTYEVDLEHWKGLSAAFRQTFRNVYERGASAILLVHGGQGTGKTLFSRRLVQDFANATEKKAFDPDKKNLWHTLVGEEPPTKATIERATIERATLESELLRVESKSQWLEDTRHWAKSNRRRVRIFVIDDAHKDVFMREWAGLTQAEYLGFKERKTETVVLGTVAEKLVEDCRGDFQRSIFVMLSNDAERMRALKDNIDKSHQGLATVLELPLPDARTKEQIIRKNTNRLNRMSYWYCLDAAGKDERIATYTVLQNKTKGFTECFQSVEQALRSEKPRPGRPANRNLITLVTLGTLPSVAKAFMEDAELPADEHHRGTHVGIWWMRGQWASILSQGELAEDDRKARLLESEFTLRWVALGMKATFVVCQAPSPGDIGERLLDLIRFSPSIAKPDEVKRHGEKAAQLDAEVESASSSAPELAHFEQELIRLGQQRSTVYEPALARRLGSYSRGFRELPAVRPDFIVGEYRPCALTAAKDHEAIQEAIKRECHALEFTCHLQNDMAGLKEYLLDKVRRYGLLLESV